jgi:hypothetical protein
MVAHCQRFKWGAHHAWHAASGFALLAVLGLVAATGIGLAYLGKNWDAANARDREAELLWVGQQYRNAIARHRRVSNQYPFELEALLVLPNTGSPRPNLRKLYRDPMSAIGKDSGWQLLLQGDRIVGVASLVERAPFRSSGFEWQDRAFEGKNGYHEWRFTHPPELADDPRLKTRPWRANDTRFTP